MFKKIIICGILLFLILSGCKRNSEIIRFHKFNDRSWYRFEKLKFEIPIPDDDKSYDVYFFAHHTRDFEYNNLEFNMIMTTPSGEERIKEYRFLVKNKSGRFTGNCNQDSCTASIVLKKGLRIEKKGILKIEIEALVPRLHITALLGVGIRVVPAVQ